MQRGMVAACLMLMVLGWSAGALPADVLLTGRPGAQKTAPADIDSPATRAQREVMVSEQIEARGVNSPVVLAALRRVPRHAFVENRLFASAYGDYPLPIGHGQTISQPYIVALMTALARPSRSMKVLEVGTGSGYQAAVLAE